MDKRRCNDTREVRICEADRDGMCSNNMGIVLREISPATHNLKRSDAIESRNLILIRYVSVGVAKRKVQAGLVRLAGHKVEPIRDQGPCHSCTIIGIFFVDA
jgi:hypothetical protein